MTLNELLQHLEGSTEFKLLDGDPAQSIEKALAGVHADAIAGEIIAALCRVKDGATAETTLERMEAVKALGPLRLKYMADDAPVEGLRRVEKVITAIDAAYNDEALRPRSN